MIEHIRSLTPFKLMSLAMVMLLALGALVFSLVHRPVQQLEKPTANPVRRDTHQRLVPDHLSISNNTRESIAKLETVLAQKSSLPRKEFQKQLRNICTEFQHANAEQIENAIMMLPPGMDSLGSFNTLIFYLFNNGSTDGISFLAERMQDHSFPAEWITSATDTGIARIADVNPRLAIEQAAAANSILPTALGRSRLVNTAISRSKIEDSSNVIDAVIALEEEKLLQWVTENSQLWRVAAESQNIQYAMDQLQSQGVKLTDDAKAQLGHAVSTANGFSEGLNIIQSSTKTDPSAIAGFIEEWFKRDPNLTLHGISGLDQALRDSLIEKNIDTVSAWDKQAAVKWAGNIQNSELRDSALNKIK